MAAKKKGVKDKPRKARDPRGAISLVVNDATLNASAKVFTVPAGETWEIASIYALLVTTITVGVRSLIVEFRNTTDEVIARFAAGVTQAASLTQHHTFGPALNQSSALAALTAHTPITPSILPPGYDIRVADSAAIDAAADDLTVRIMAEVTRF